MAKEKTGPVMEHLAGQEQPKRVLDDRYQTTSEFEHKISAAVHQKVESIEATQEIIDYYNPNGLGGSKFFIYKGVKVFPTGRTEEIENELDQDLSEKIHGKNEAFVERPKA